MDEILPVLQRESSLLIAAGVVLAFSLVILFVRYRKFLLRKCCPCTKAGRRRRPRPLKDDRGLGNGEEARVERVGARFLLRACREYELQEAVTGMGVRRGKAYLLVKRRETRDNLVMVASRLPAFAKEMVAEPEQRETLLKMLTACVRSRHVEAPLDVRFATGEGLIFSFHRLYAHGSLRDAVHAASCRSLYHTKYAGATGKPLLPHEAASVARQVLLGLEAIRLAGLPPHGHLHSGNVMLPARGVAVVGEYVNTLLCVAPRRHERSIEALQADDGVGGGDPDVVCFGHVLHEMLRGCDPAGVPLPGEEEGGLDGEGGGAGGIWRAGGKGNEAGHGMGDDASALTAGGAGERRGVFASMEEAMGASLRRRGRPSVRGLLDASALQVAAEVSDKELWLPENRVLEGVQHKHVVLAGALVEASRQARQQEEEAFTPESVGAFGAALRLDLLRAKANRGDKSSPYRGNKGDLGESMRPLTREVI